MAELQQYMKASAQFTRWAEPVTANVETEDEMFVEIERVWSELDQGMILPAGVRLLAPVRAVSGVPA
jgi:hypothetical protein